MRIRSTPCRGLGSLILGIALLSSCQSGADPNDDDTGFFISYRANGRLIEYRDPLLVHGVFTAVGSQHVFAAEGVSPTGTIMGSSVNVSAMDVAPITTATYSGFRPVQRGFAIATILYGTGGIEYSNTDADSDIRVTLTEITPVHVRGTFSGTVKFAGRPNVSITAGEFYVPGRN
ncbi:MAG: hypothetical protein L0271_10870 [Gemmatimonadetes bacterium]|nr:hypothetical protein [Gemmatimonadota bacterium]